jgi:tryptophan-rich sensory protein
MELYDNFQPHLHRAEDPIPPAKTWWIWKVFWILLAVTAVEVGVAYANYELAFTSKQVLKYFYIGLTIVKAYYIIFSYMHLGDEKKSFRLTLGILVILMVYFIVLMMIEGLYQEDVRLIFPDYLISDMPAAAH